MPTSALAADCTLGPRLGAAGHAYIREHMPVDAIVRRHEALYERVVGDDARGAERLR